MVKNLMKYMALIQKRAYLKIKLYMSSENDALAQTLFFMVSVNGKCNQDSVKVMELYLNCKEYNNNISSTRVVTNYVASIKSTWLYAYIIYCWQSYL